MKKTFSLFLLVFVIFTVGCNPTVFEPIIEEPDGTFQQEATSYILPELSVKVMKTGKSDAIIIESDGRLMVIDTADKDDGAQLSAYMRSRNINSIDYLILSHLDKDHIGGAARVIDDMRVKKLIQANYSKKSDEHDEYTAAYERHEITPLLLTSRMEFEFAGAWVTLIPAAKEEYKESNDYSIMTEITYGKHRFLFAGDAESERLSEYLSGDVQPFDFVKMPHHGAYDDMTEKFIEVVSPTYAVITCSNDNMPDRTVLSLLQNADSKVFLTADKYVTAITDGVELKVN